MKQAEIINKKWTIGICNTGEKCWCRTIGIAGEKEDSDDYIAPSGSIPKEIAEHIVKIHNKWLKVRRRP